MDPKFTSSQVDSSNKRLSDMVLMVFCTVGKSFKTSKFIANLRRMMSKHAQITCKVIENMIFHHHSARVSLVVPKHYEFSCSNTPAHYSSNKGKKYGLSFFSPVHPSALDDDKLTVCALEKILQMLDNEEAENSPVRQFTIMDSPPPLKDFEGDSHVDQQADEFIHRFYARLRLKNVKD